MLILNISSYNTLTIKIPYVSAIQGQNLTNVPEHLVNATLALAKANLTTQQVKANATAEQVKANATTQQVKANAQTEQLESFRTIITVSITGIGALIIAPLLLSMYLTYRTGRIGTNMRTGRIETNIHPLVMSQLYRVLIAIGVIFTVLVILIYLNSMIWFNMSIQSPNITALLETQKNFLTIIGTAFASLVAFYFGTRASQGSNAERTTAITKPEAGQKALEVIDVNPIDGSMGIEVESPLTATFSAPVRSSTINANTFSVKDANSNPVQGKITLTDNNTAIRFNPISPLNRNTRYTITITKGLMDISGASMSADKEWHFTTLA
jgi:Bacterial Ig-like domain